MVIKTRKMSIKAKKEKAEAEREATQSIQSGQSGMVDVTVLPARKVVTVPQGATVFEAITAAGVKFDSPCGGRGKCGKCRVSMREGTGPPTEMERKFIEKSDLEAGVRLACQAIAQTNMTVEIEFEAQSNGRKEKLVTPLAEVTEPGSGAPGPGTEDRPADPWIRKVSVSVPTASLEYLQPELARLIRALEHSYSSKGEPRFGLDVLRQASSGLRRGGGRVTLVLAEGVRGRVTDGRGEVIAIEPGDPAPGVYGIAFDIGTTTVVASLMDLRTGQAMETVSATNEQAVRGADVMSRIAFALREPNGLEDLRSRILRLVNGLIDTILERTGIRRDHLYGFSFVGNTAMHHLLLGLYPESLAFSPYVPVISRALCFKADGVGVHGNPGALAYFLPNIAGFVGADTVGVILATRLFEKKGITLAIDIGTNGEVILGSRDGIVACSTAAGPAFEGAHIMCGMRAMPGAIEGVIIRNDSPGNDRPGNDVPGLRFEPDSDIEIRTIGEARPRGICGSGLVDAVAVMLRLGIIDSSGRMVRRDEAEARLGLRLCERLIEGESGPEFILVDAAESQNGRRIVISQRDIRELQLGKGALRTGIEVLQKVLGVSEGDVAEVFLAGAFGNYIKKESALAIGLLPPYPLERVKPVGNAAGAGARQALISRSEQELASMIPDRVRYVELVAHPDFQKVFMEAMMFPATSEGEVV